MASRRQGLGPHVGGPPSTDPTIVPPYSITEPTINFFLDATILNSLSLSNSMVNLSSSSFPRVTKDDPRVTKDNPRMTYDDPKMTPG